MALTLGVRAAFFVGVFAVDGFIAVFAELVPTCLLGAVVAARPELGLTTAIFLTGVVEALVVVTTAFLAGVLLEVCVAIFVVGLARGLLAAGLTAVMLVLTGAFTGVLEGVLTSVLDVALLVATDLLTVLVVGLETVLPKVLEALVLLEFLFELMGVGLFKKLLLFSNTTIQ